MFTRIVKMEFKEEEIPAFLANFEIVKEKIRNFPGCRFLELYCDKADATIYFTYSKWDAEADLENYRNSELFKEVWATTKPMFRSKAQAWSVDTLYTLT
ncbi:quinol monooxygenase YgiN [Ulvibacter sp. MAR_2010_11]|uniref:putative quinol monooxygenase n=1 Tax=Ulvibacter sp. MAR_2010_11 TaxID=1250229 RepID=UPI000C2C28CF|nr:antibiotic biosynthesis monooxygenase family protein [Ulvibacter sp. MAR_2010_11]PKA84336.1 quinol monooxygenase YgiN [Ulvibacter sp. MAR_2010_11]